MRIFSAGSPSGGHEDLCRQIGVPKLYSVMSPAELSRIKKYDPSWGIPLLVDSGAHSYNKLTIAHVGHGARSSMPSPREHFESYFKLMEKCQGRPITFVELDVYAVLSRQEIDAQFARVQALGGIDYMRVYHTMMDGGTARVVQEWVDQGLKYIGVGAGALPIFDRIFKITRDKVRVHGFAMTRTQVLRKFPFYSVDSTTALTASIFGVASSGYGLEVVGKEQQRRRRSVSLAQDRLTRLKVMLQQFKQFADDMTALWRARGVDWHDDD